jgi:L-amino acid N-acyltransferase YncA
MKIERVRSLASMRIRDCDARDMLGIASICTQAARYGSASFEIDPPNVSEMVKRRAAVIDGGYPYLVAEQDGTIVGFCYVSAYRPRPAYRFSAEDSIYVKPEYQSPGIGRALMNKLLERCVAENYRLMIAVIGDLDNAPSVGLHASHGFKHAGILPNVGWKFDRWLDSVFMVRELGAASSCPT